MAARSILSTVHRPCLEDQTSGDDDSDIASSSTSGSSSTDEDIVNGRLTPNWCIYRNDIASRGFRLDTCRDVKDWYHQYWDAQASDGHSVSRDLPGYLRACNAQNENDLCRDAGLPDRLFRGTQCSTGVKVVIKAVHLLSREYDVIRFLSCPALRSHPMNHCIPVLDLIEVPKDKIVFIVMAEWPSQLAVQTPSNLGYFVDALRQCIEHIVFMHMQNVAHLDISTRNILTDCKGHYACIDYESSARYDKIQNPRCCNTRLAEVPPELEQGLCSDPYKVDVYCLGILMLRAMDLTGYDIPELYPIVRQMICAQFEQRPSAAQILLTFKSMVANIHPSRLASQSCRY